MHLNPVADPEARGPEHLTVAELVTASAALSRELREADVRRAVMVILASGLLDEPNAGEGLRSVLVDRLLEVSYAPDLRRPDAVDRLEAAHSYGVRSLKFHPYLQRITARDYDSCRTLARWAASHGMFLLVCCSYGTRALGRHSGVRLAARLSEEVSAPIVMSHAGGAQVLDAMLAAEEGTNLFLETSFSLPYYLGSSVETDFAFAMRKLGTERWMFGSDAPYFGGGVDGVAGAIDLTVDFMERHGFSAGDVENVLYRTAASVLA